LGLGEQVMRLAAELLHESSRAEVLEEALALHRLLIARGLYRGRERVSTALACLYAAARYRRVPYEPLEFLVLAARLMRSRARRALRAAEEAWVEAGRDGVRRLMRRLGEEERLVLRALRADEGPRAPYYVHRRWARRFMSLYRTIALEVYGRSPPPILPEDAALYYARWLGRLRGGVPEGFEALAERAAAALSGVAGGRSARRIAFAGILAAARLLGAQVSAEDLAEAFGGELVALSRPTLREIERLSRTAQALLSERPEQGVAQAGS